MRDPELTSDQALELLAATPRRIEALTTGRTAEQLRMPPSPGEWSAIEILAHIRACADVRGGVALRILAEDHPRIRDASPRVDQRGTDYVDLEFAPSLRAFTEQRADLLAVLRPLSPERWSRTATVIRNGKPLEWSVQWYAEWLGSHERIHIEQIAATIETVAATR